MKILDRYLLRQFAQVFSICFLSLIGLYVVIDAFGHLDSFSAHAKQNGNLLGIIAEYYGYQSISFFDRTSGMLAMISAMFTVIWLQRHQEMTAMMAAGISKFRIIRSLIVAAIAASLLGVVGREIVIPRVRDQLTRNVNDLGGTQARDLEARFDGETDILISGDQVVAQQRRIINPTFVLPRPLARYGKQLVAANAYFLEATSNHPAGYLLRDVSAPAKLDRRASLQQDNQRIVITPRDAKWLQPGEAFVVSNVSFKLVMGGSAWWSFASTRELVAEMSSPSTDLGADVHVAVHTRVMQPISDATLLMLGLPLMFSRRNRNVYLSVGICLLVALAFTLVTLACQSLGGLSLMRPTLAAWLPIMIFLPLAVGMSHTLRT